MVVLTETQKVTFTLDPRTGPLPGFPNGRPARVDGAPQWALSNPGVGSITPSADGLSAVFKATATGDTQVSCTADADLGAGVRELVATDSISVKAVEAVSLGFVVGTPDEQ